jgi:hypothetical protein
VTVLPDAAAEVLERGVLCYLATPSPSGPHTTPVVFALQGGRIWGTTGRRTTKAKLWRGEPLAGGLVRAGERALTFRGTVKMYDLLDPSTWAASVLRSRQLTMAAARFTAKNARFFAGYARDASQLPLSWTPPARVLFSVDVTCGAVLEGHHIVERWGSWGSALRGGSGRRATTPVIETSDLPEEVRELTAAPDEVVVGVPHAGGPVVLPGSATETRGGFAARVPIHLLELAEAGPSDGATLVLDRASAWRASKMRGLMLRGPASVKVGDADAVVRIRPRSAVWWVGWSTGTVRAS